MKLNTIPLVTALLPALAAHLCYLVAAYHGHVSWCFPYFPDCVSISATGRHGLESVIFRAALIPAAILMMIYWKLSRDWLRALGTRIVRRNRIMVWLGMTAALGLFVYASIIGEVGDLYYPHRRIAVILFYVFTYLAQVLMTVQMAPLAGIQGPWGARDGQMPASLSRGLVVVLMAICGVVAVLGAASLLSWAFNDQYRRYEDAFEWGLTLLLLGHTFVTYFAWRDSGFQARFTITGTRSLLHNYRDTE